MTEQYPLISAITLIGQNAIDDILLCIKCFEQQTYPNKELIIINNAKNQFAASEINIKKKNVLVIDLPTHCTTGSARNHGQSASNGQIIAQFDADCWHHPKRLEIQIAALVKEEAQISILSKILQYSFISGRAAYYTNQRKAILNTMIYLRQKEVNYPDIEKNEEWIFLQALINKSKYKPISIDIPELYCKLLTSKEERMINPINKNLSPEHFEIIHQITKQYSI